MHTETTRIADQLSRSLAGDAWYGDSILTILSTVTAEQAAARPIATAHSIWELVLHMTTWIDAVRNRLRGESGEVTPQEDWHTAPDKPTPQAWTDTVAAFRHAYEALREEVDRTTDERLDAISPAGVYTYYILLHGAIQHTIYHAGQIALLKKMFT